MKEFNLPALEYCSLERATRFIGAGCEVEDLLHWAEIGAINLSYKITSSVNAYVYFDDININVAKYILNFIESDHYTYIPISDNSTILSTDFRHCATIDDVVSSLTEVSDKPVIKAYIKGIWDISKYTINNKLSSPYTELAFSPLGNSYLKCNAILNNPEFGISLSDLLISKKAISIILGSDNKLRTMPMISDASRLLEKEKLDNKKDISNTVANNRASLIKSLLAVHYGDDVANNPRKFIENKDSEICKDFQLKGIRLPSGKTVAEWLKDAEIDLT
ncbi:hypothetical protein INA60_002650 [Salmonella enterica]|uniref:Uncharacterized protein n=1 Tax=Salmonella enterica I TaxID=59201 RepID=A0A3R1AHN7_SALET|nr:hypothetical protein [Salmonella enterica subsp. enterica serovar Dahomey]EAW9081458.1 hypothetical protein [Salmonella enterica]EEB7410663.1 hypothetical protein [Salmonella enterica]EGJ5832970.1 hypothetical protein [Salmonella enterica]MML56004.1 hypothetical protein [Salmonella enterica subsp. enterica serovar Kidderminster]